MVFVIGNAELSSNLDSTFCISQSAYTLGERCVTTNFSSNYGVNSRADWAL